jgi:hypothetical protein
LVTIENMVFNYPTLAEAYKECEMSGDGTRTRDLLRHGQAF